MNGVSASRNAEAGLPALAASSWTISSALSSSASARSRSIFARSPGVRFAYPSKARRAAPTARSTSSEVDDGASAIVSPVAGLRTGSRLPSAGSTDSPSMKLFRVDTAVEDMARTYHRSGVPRWTQRRKAAAVPRRLVGSAGGLPLPREDQAEPCAFASDALDVHPARGGRLAKRRELDGGAVPVRMHHAARRSSAPR